MSIIIQKRIIICLINSAWSPEYLFETNVSPIKIKSKHIRLRFYRKNHKAFKFSKMTVGWEMISMSSERMNHEKRNALGTVWAAAATAMRAVLRWLFDSYKVGLKFDIQDETDVTRNPAYTVACEDCMHVVEGRNRNSVYVGSNYVVIRM